MKIVWAWLTQRMVKMWDTLYASSTDPVEDSRRCDWARIDSFELHRNNLDVAFHKHQIELFDLSRVKCDA